MWASHQIILKAIEPLWMKIFSTGSTSTNPTLRYRMVWQRIHLKLDQNMKKMIEAAGGIDLQILGVGTDGHIGFNEPTSSLGSIARVKTLTQQTMADNSRFRTR